MTPAETIKRLEAVRNWHISEERYYAEKNTGITATHTMFIADIESALAALRESQSAREKAAREAVAIAMEVVDKYIIGKPGATGLRVKAAILKHFNLEAK